MASYLNFCSIFRVLTHFTSFLNIFSHNPAVTSHLFSKYRFVDLSSIDFKLMGPINQCFRGSAASYIQNCMIFLIWPPFPPILPNFAPNQALTTTFLSKYKVVDLSEVNYLTINKLFKVSGVMWPRIFEIAQFLAFYPFLPHF